MLATDRTLNYNVDLRSSRYFWIAAFTIAFNMLVLSGVNNPLIMSSVCSRSKVRWEKWIVQNGVNTHRNVVKAEPATRTKIATLTTTANFDPAFNKAVPIFGRTSFANIAKYFPILCNVAGDFGERSSSLSSMDSRTGIR